MDGPAIACQALRKVYPGGRRGAGGDVVAVDGIDLSVARGECFGLLGPNGAGKTTTVEILEGLADPTSGDVQLFGLTWRGDGDGIRQRIGVALQETRLSEKLSVAETLELFRSFYRRPRPLEVLLDAVALREKRDAWVGKLSGGQKQRLALACALIGDPEILFLDEPTTGLDPQSRRQVWQLVGDYRAGGGTVLLTTHYMEEAERLCDRVAIVDHGRVISEGSPRALIAALGADHVVEFDVGAATAERELQPLLRDLPSVTGVRREAGSWLLVTGEPHRALPALIAALQAQNLPLARLATRQATLDDVFVSLTGRSLRDD
ncbi:MAG TPA: ABC transporter ATP-binding protein [Polyangia bacterium]|nr:ABC transporter ATP-binding protein [Polyangia bacterium]